MNKISKCNKLINILIETAYNDLVDYCDKNGSLTFGFIDGYVHQYANKEDIEVIRIYAIKSCNGDLQMITSYREYIKYIYGENNVKWEPFKSEKILFYETMLSIIEQLDMYGL